MNISDNIGKMFDNKRTSNITTLKSQLKYEYNAIHEEMMVFFKKIPGEIIRFRWIKKPKYHFSDYDINKMNNIDMIVDIFGQHVTFEYNIQWNIYQVIINYKNRPTYSSSFHSSEQLESDYMNHLIEMIPKYKQYMQRRKVYNKINIGNENK